MTARMRANALPETALTLGMVMLVLLGLVRLAVIGYEQSEADGAAFVAAHAASLTQTTGQQKSRGQSHASRDFPGASNINITQGTGGPNGSGYVVGSDSRAATALLGGLVNVQSNIVEPVIGTPPNTSADFSASAKPPNCLSANPSTPSCGGVYIAHYDPANASDPFDQYECHLAAYEQLTNGTPGSNTPLGKYPWPENYEPTTAGSINYPAVRSAGTWIGAAPKDTLGPAVKPIFNWTASNPC